MKTIFGFYKNYKPFAFFTIAACLLTLIGLAFFIPVLVGFLQIGLVRIPTLVISVLFWLCAVQAFFAGLILDNIIQNSKQNFEMRLIECEHKLSRGKENM